MEYEVQLAIVLIIPKARVANFFFVETVSRALIMEHVMVKPVNAVMRMKL